jgi:predicted ester cyclase
MSPEDNKAMIRHIIEEALNGGRLEIADEFFTEDYMVHVAGRPEGVVPRGPESFKQVIGIWHRACSDWHMTIEEMVAEGDTVANRFTTRATHDGPLFGIPPTHHTFVVNGMEFHRLRDGKVAETWVSDDLPGILAQLGLIDVRSLIRSGGRSAADPF